ncbi:hypothetical protein BD770DRAFT_407803 [Pilaira anomala]|nr:hypothetical protein BD770DRAFT_407803 [Pilaira anomala]
MFIRFATLTLLAAVVMTSVSAVSTNSAALVETASGPSGAELAAPMLRTSLSRRKVAALLERRRSQCDHHNHRNYNSGDDVRHYHRPRRHSCSNNNFNDFCGDSDDHDEYEHEHNDYDDDDYYECDECDECDDDERYMSWEDYEDETT